MKPYPRIRKTIKWGGAAVTVLLVVVWIGSGVVGVAWSDSRGDEVGIGGGLVWANYREFKRPSEGLVFARLPLFALQLGPGWKRLPAGWELELPIWPIAAILGAVTSVAWRLDTLARRRAGGRLNLCPKCHYDRTGLVGVGGAGAVCPECGLKPTGS